jgi:hypothetical protein
MSNSPDLPSPAGEPRGRALDAIGAAGGLADLARGFLRQILGRDAVSALLHVVVLLAAVVVIRPLFMSGIAHGHYDAPSIVVSLILDDIEILARASASYTPAAPRLLFLLVPTAIFYFTRRRLTWDDWEHGRSMRAPMMVIIGMMAWAGSTLPYNVYFDQAHLFDRALLAALAVATWSTPLAAPFAARLAIVMLRQGSIPIGQDTFDYRAIADLLVVFSAFVWLSYRRSFHPKHFLLLALGVFGSYYYASGIAKWTFGPRYSWLLENRLSNLTASAYVHGWLGFIPERWFMAFIGFARKFDVPLAVFTLIVEYGGLAAFFIRPSLTRLWLLLSCLLHLGIFAMSGIFFWKWAVTTLTLFLWLGRDGGAQVLRAMCRNVLNLAFGIAVVYYSLSWIWFSPQIGVAWYDTRFMEHYELHAVDANGSRYLVHPEAFSPGEVHWEQGALCYATFGERSLTSIYGTTYYYDVFKQIENIKTPSEALEIFRRAPVCDNPSWRKTFDDFLQRFFGNLNERGGFSHRWLSWIGRPTHIWLHPQGTLYEGQAPVVRVELWRTLVLHHEGALHRLELKLVRSIDIERAPK